MRVVTAITCEDIRPELGGRVTLVGVFSGDLNIKSMPAILRFAFYLELETDRSRQEQCDIAIKLGDEQLVSTRAHSIVGTDRVVLNLQPINVTIKQSTRLKVEIATDAGEVLTPIDIELNHVPDLPDLLRRFEMPPP